MKSLLYILLLWIPPGIIHAQSGTIAATISFQDPSPSCGLYGADDLSFGSVRVPGSGTVSVTVNAQNGRVTTVPSGHSVIGASVGDFYVDGDHVSSYSIGMNTQVMPNALTSQSNPSNTISYAATTATSLNGTTWSSAPTPSRGQFYRRICGRHLLQLPTLLSDRRNDQLYPPDHPASDIQRHRNPEPLMFLTRPLPFLIMSCLAGSAAVAKQHAAMAVAVEIIPPTLTLSVSSARPGFRADRSERRASRTPSGIGCEKWRCLWDT